MSEVISDKEYIKMVVLGEHKSSHVEHAQKSILYIAESIEVREGVLND